MYEDLKHKVKSKAGIDHLIASDCKRIANDIFETTQKRVSETTLKRFFGFASLKYALSGYTLSVLTAYTETNCSVTITTKINPSKAKRKVADDIKFDLEDGALQSNQCFGKSDLEKLKESEQKNLPIKIHLTRRQVKHLFENVKKPGL
ncbi:MAG TPA: hypothetical protein VK541_10695 [Pedobacter sp.]|uniref:hypothetical protein n=1 Tax=Pedobacter sp. TaxID=1411316 RepID=UPI002C8F31A2|nr:hypothetical protein [Pedobacter sp.]HMI02941.1 hypothetical protein [Pedobacter sp.]